MRGTASALTPLTARKRLLVIESEIHRAEFGRDWQKLRTETGALAEQARSLGTMASAGMALFSTGSMLRGIFRRQEKTSWLQTLINGARAGFSVWQALRPRVR